MDPLIFAGGMFSVQVHLTEVQWLLSKKTTIYRGSRFQEDFFFFWGGGGGGGVGGCLSPIETHITCDFPGGPDPILLYLEVDIFF